MKGNKLYQGYSENQIFKDEEDKAKILAMKDVEREKIIGERVESLNRQKELNYLLNENNNKNKEVKKNKLSYDEAESSDSRELGEIENENKNRSRRRKTTNSLGGDDSELSMDDDEDKQIKKENLSISLEEIEKIRLTRDFFVKYYNYPIFDENVKGAFIRVNLSSIGKQDISFYSGYNIGEIGQIINNEEKPYNFMGNKCTKYVKLILSDLDIDFDFKVISNSKILEEELNQWLKDKQKIPTQEDITRIQQNIEKIENYNLSGEELNKILSKKKKDRIKYKDSTLNVTEELDLALEKYRYNKEKYEEEKEKEKEREKDKGNKDKEEKSEKDKYFKIMKEIEEDIKQLQKMKEERDRKAKMNSENDIVAKINEGIRQKQKMDEKMSLLSRKRRKDRNDSIHKIFKRVDCHPTPLFDNQEINKEKKNEEKEIQKDKNEE